VNHKTYVLSPGDELVASRFVDSYDPVVLNAPTPGFEWNYYGSSWYACVLSCQCFEKKLQDRPSTCLVCIHDPKQSFFVNVSANAAAITSMEKYESVLL